MSGYYNSQSEIEAVVRGFETCNTAPADFSHQCHLAVAVSYLHDSTMEQATELMRAGLLRYLDHHGVDPRKYHESLTIFWMRLIQALLQNMSADISLLEKTNAVIETLADSRLAFEYYSRGLLMSDDARKSWIEPDLRQIKPLINAENADQKQ
jgi:hypothetical protein